MLIVQICDFGEDGDACYRVHEPSRHLGRLEGVTAVDCHFYHRHLPDLAELADVLVIQFVNDWELLSICERRRAAGKITVFEANDDLFDIHAWSPIAERWKNPSIPEMYRQFIRACDAVQTTSKVLAARWKGVGAREVAIFRNHLTEIAPLPAPAARPLTVGWGGSPGHFADLRQAAPSLQRWLMEHPEVHLAIMTHELARPFFSLPDHRYHFTHFGSLDDYYRFLPTLDIGLAPLLPTNYNRGRSDVKYLEYASRGVVGVYADLETYRESVVPGETGLVFKSPDEMITCLERLRTDSGLRQRLRRQAHAEVTRDRLLSDRIGERVSWYRGLLKGPTRSVPLPVEITADATREGGYLRLPAGEPERALTEALTRPTTEEILEHLGRLLERYPRYLAALQSQGQLLNNRHDHVAALNTLERALDQAPLSARTLNEIARAFFRLGDKDRARAMIEEVIRLCPRYYPAWSSLLRLLHFVPSPDGEAWAERAESIFPTCYALGLTGVEACPPERAAAVILRVLDRIAPNITSRDRTVVLDAFRPAILAAITTSPLVPDVIRLLERACQVFPESARLASELALALHRCGQHDEAFRQEARALELRRQAALDRAEFPQEEESPHSWMLAEHIVRSWQRSPREQAESGLGRPMAATVASSRPVPDIIPFPTGATMTTDRTDEMRDRAYRDYQAGDKAAAERLCGQLLASSPNHDEAVYLLGVIAHDRGDMGRACELFDRAAALAPANAVYINARGEAQLALGRPSDAMNSFRRAIAARPGYARAHNNVGLLMHAQGDLAAAAACFSEAVNIDPRYATARNNLGAVLQAQYKFPEAIAHFREAIKARPDYAEAHFNLGSALQWRGETAAAVASYREAIRIRPDYAKAHFHLGQVYQLFRQDYDALACFETAVRLQPDDAEMLRKLGTLLTLKKDWPAAMAALEKAAALSPDDPRPFADLFEARLLICDWRDYDANQDRLWTAAQAEIASGQATSVLPLRSLTLPWDQSRHLAVARSHSGTWVTHHRRQSISPFNLHRPARKRGDRLRIGYMSGDYCDHPIGHLLHGFFGPHDRERFEVFAYSFGPRDDSSYRRQIMDECEHFVDVAHLSYIDTARRIAADGIDILVDVMGHTGVSRLGALALKPAPIQVSFLGMLGTMGADYIDYLITDSIVTPPESAPYFTEKFVTLPSSYLIAELEDVPPGEVSRREQGLPEDGFVFCSFNTAYKIEPRTFALWMRILSRVDGSVLWLWSPGKVVEDNLRREASARGVDPDRLVFAPFLRRPEHIRRHQAADLFLDTLIYNAAATASLALQLGLPVLTCPGETFASRVGASLLTTVGLPELIAPDVAEYERIAIDLARNPQDLRRLRGWLTATKSTSPLFDTPRFVHNLESAYAEMWRIHAAGHPPRPIQVADNYDQVQGEDSQFRLRTGASSDSQRRAEVVGAF